MDNFCKVFRSDFLFPRPTIVSGMGTIFNIWGNYYRFNGSPTPEIADKRAILNDWGVVGNDLRNAIASFDERPK